MPQSFVKDPNDILDYQIDWSAWLGVDTIVTSTWFVPAGITKNSDSKTTGVTLIWLSGGTSGTTYTLPNRITTGAGRTVNLSIYITVREK
jgi:uncharacterized RDD family membrane protein YckC